jgi:hypothetical protein
MVGEDSYLQIRKVLASINREKKTVIVTNEQVKEAVNHFGIA